MWSEYTFYTTCKTSTRHLFIIEVQEAMTVFWEEFSEFFSTYRSHYPNYVNPIYIQLFESVLWRSVHIFQMNFIWKCRAVPRQQLQRALWTQYLNRSLNIIIISKLCRATFLGSIKLIHPFFITSVTDSENF